MGVLPAHGLCWKAGAWLLAEVGFWSSWKLSGYRSPQSLNRVSGSFPTVLLLGHPYTSALTIFPWLPKAPAPPAQPDPGSPGYTQVLSATTRFCLRFTQGCSRGLVAASGPSATTPCLEPGPVGCAGGIWQIPYERHLLPSSYQLLNTSHCCTGLDQGFFEAQISLTNLLTPPV